MLFHTKKEKIAHNDFVIVVVVGADVRLQHDCCRCVRPSIVWWYVFSVVFCCLFILKLESQEVTDASTKRACESFNSTRTGSFWQISWAACGTRRAKPIVTRPQSQVRAEVKVCLSGIKFFVLFVCFVCFFPHAPAQLDELDADIYMLCEVEDCSTLVLRSVLLSSFVFAQNCQLEQATVRSRMKNAAQYKIFFVQAGGDFVVAFPNFVLTKNNNQIYRTGNG